LLYVQSQQTEITAQNITVPYGGKTQFTLPDGSAVWLNSGSSFSYPNKFDGERIVELTGEAYFNVEKQKEPFKVKTKYGEVEVFGTQFNVKAYENDNHIETTLKSGEVLIQAHVQVITQMADKRIEDLKSVTEDYNAMVESVRLALEKIALGLGRKR